MMGQNEVKSLIDHCKCPILQTLMEDPVTAADGHTYERTAISSWIANRGARAISPMTGEQLVHHELQPNFTLKKIIEEYKAKTPMRKQQKATQNDIELAMKLRQEELDSFLQKQQNRIAHLQQQKDEVASQLGPIAQENMRLKNELDHLKQMPRVTQLSATQLPFANLSLKENKYTQQLTQFAALETQQQQLMEGYSANVLKRAIANRGIHRQLNKTRLHKRHEDLSHEMEILDQALKQKIKVAEQKTIDELQKVETDYLAKAELIRNAIKAANEADNDEKITELTLQRAQLRKEYENSKATIKKQSFDIISDYEQSHAKLLSEKKSELNQVKLAKDSKHQTLGRRSVKIQSLTEVIVQQKQGLLANIEQQQQQVSTLSSAVTQNADKLKQRFKSQLNDGKVADKMAVGLFKAAKTSHDKVTAMAKSVEKDVKVEEVNALLKWVVDGNLEEAEKLLQKNPKLALAQGNLKDLAERTFENITAFQYAVWSLDNEMWEIILKYLDKSEAAKQLEALENDRKDIHEKYGKHFDFAPLLNAYQTYMDNYKELSISQREGQWCKVIGKAQRLVPAWYIYAFCESRDKAAWPTQDFTKPVKREYKEGHLNKWFTTSYKGGLLGDTFGMSRETASKASPSLGCATTNIVVTPEIPAHEERYLEPNPEWLEWSRSHLYLSDKVAEERRWNSVGRGLCGAIRNLENLQALEKSQPPRERTLTRIVAAAVPPTFSTGPSSHDKSCAVQLQYRLMPALAKLRAELKNLSNAEKPSVPRFG